MARAEMVADLLKSLRQEYPEWKAALPMGQADDCDVCAGGALLLYSAKHGLVDIDDLLYEMNGDPDPEYPYNGIDLDLDSDDISEDWRFPTPSTLQGVLAGLNSSLDAMDAERFATEIVTANDDGDPAKAERLMGEALMWRSSDHRQA